MNTTTTPPPNATPAPPVIPEPCVRPSAKPEELAPVSGLGGALEALLRQPRRVMDQLGRPQAGRLTATLFFIATVCALLYGFVTGTFSGGVQLWAAPVKIAAGLLLSGLICLPSLYIFACLSGSRARLGEVVGLVGGLLALTTVLLIGFAPVAWVFSQSTESVAAMGALHLLFGLVAVGFGLRFLAAAVAHLDAQSSLGLKLWMLIFLLVALQMTTALRPIVGTAETFLPTEKKFFVSHWGACLEQTSPPGAKDRSAGRETTRPD